VDKLIFKILILFLACGDIAMATNGITKKRKASGASSMGGKSSMGCFKNAVEGNPDCAQRADEPVCLGLKKSLENSLKKSECLKRFGSECMEWGHNEKTQSEWISIAAFHLSEFGLCVKAKYGSENSNGRTEALQDQSFLTFIEQLEDGSADYLLDRQEILLRTLRGDRFSFILKDSDLQRKLGPSIFHRLVNAADTAAPLKKEGGVIEEELHLSRQNHGEKPSSFKDIMNFRNPIDSERERPSNLILSKTNSAETEKHIRNIATQAQGEKKLKIRTKSLYSLGLDLSIFDQISIAYAKKEKEMKGLDQFVLENPVAPAKDLREALRLGSGL